MPVIRRKYVRTVNGGKISVKAGVTQTIRDLYLDSDTPCERGLWGKVGNTEAEHTSPRLIGDGLLRVRGKPGVVIFF